MSGFSSKNVRELGSQAFCMPALEAPLIFFKLLNVEHIETELNPGEEPCISNIERVTAIFVGQGLTKYHFLKILEFQYLIEN